MRKAIEKFWKSYKYRFVPWIALNMKHRPRGKFPEKNFSKNGIAMTNIDNEHLPVDHVSNSNDVRISEADVLNLLVEFFQKCHYPNRTNVLKDLETASCRNLKIMHEHFGFSIKRGKSTIADNAGTGVFVESGIVKAGSLVALYPGTIYMPFEPLLFPSLGNPYIFRCSDGVHIDGNDRWISKSIFSSCSSRDRFDFYTPSCDISWLTKFPVNPLNIGHYVNNRSRTKENNVVYQECLIPLPVPLSDSCAFPIDLLKFIPNVWSDPRNNRFGLRVIPLVAVRDIHKGEEILSSYFTVLHSEEIKSNG